MRSKRKPPPGSRAHEIVAEGRRARASRDAGYRGRALEILPWVCASCGRDFESRNLHELTVHHKDHNHANNPPDGSNWELLCGWCHDNEHNRREVAGASGSAGARRGAAGEAKRATLQSPFAGLDKLLRGEE